MDLEQLVECVGDANVVRRELLSERATSYWNAEPTDAAILIKPTDTEMLSQVLRLCNEQGQSVVVQGGLTGVVAGAEPESTDVIISLEKMNQVESIDDLDNVAIVQAGATLQQVQEQIAEQGLLFPLDLGARGSCTIGGNISTNAGGINVLRYGMMRELVLGLEVVLADGRILSNLYPMLKNNTGYDLKQLFIGSEGTLGVVTKAALRLFPQPTSRQTAMVGVTSFDEVITLLKRLKSGLAGTLSAFEVMWNNYYVAVTGEEGHAPPMDRDYAFYIIAEAEGFDAEQDEERFQTILSDALDAEEIETAIIAQSDKDRASIWQVREDFEPALPAYLYDISLPVGNMETFADRLREDLAGTFPQGESLVFGHIADGNLHIFIRPDEGHEGHEICDKAVYENVAKLGGSVSAEHGIGTEKKAWLNLNRSADELALMVDMKGLLDPNGILNRRSVF